MDLNTLNDKQREAVTHTEGPLLVLAGAGSGKTRVLTHRIAYLIQECGISPYNVLALTFTNKAAAEMRERVEKLVGCSAQNMWVMTFHAMCARILRMDIDKLGYTKTFVIYDDSDQQSLIKKIIKELNLNDKVFTPRSIASKISDAKNHSLDVDGFFRDAYEAKEIVAAYHAYQKQLKQNNALDFDDLLLLTCKLLTSDSEILKKYRSRFSHILVDEYQDTNLVQYNIIHLLALNHQNICVVGDDDQSIYGWRGADIRNILEFEKDFPGACTIRLEQNYRSSSVILDAANLVISNNKGRKSKKLWTEHSGGTPVCAYEAADERDEANHICSDILQGVRCGERNYNEFAILYRTHALSRVLEMYLKSYDIPYRVYGGTSFFQRAEVKDIMAYLRLLRNPNDDVAFLRIINVPRRGLGDAALQSLQEHAAVCNLSLLPACMALPDAGMTRYKPKLTLFTDTIMTIYREIGNLPLADVVEMLLTAIGYDAYLKEDRKENYEARADIVKEFVGYIREFTEGMDETVVDVLQSFLENVALFSQIDQMDEQSGSVSLMTLHSAKGLEFPVVFLPGLEEGVFPSSQSMFDMEKLEEERRLMYVGITRAKEELHVSNAKQRMLYGKINASMPSIFWKELSPALPDQETPKSRFVARMQQSQTAATDAPASAAPAHTGRQTNPRYAAAKKKTGPVINPNGFGISQNAPTPQSSRSPSVAVNTKDRIRHGSFGDGTVLSVNGSGNAQIVEIAFDSGINKKFAAAYAPIAKI
ncbi:MAG: UvrD-helicase domain-containing protein [Clostridia bacterium]